MFVFVFIFIFLFLPTFQSHTILSRVVHIFPNNQTDVVPCICLYVYDLSQCKHSNWTGKKWTEHHRMNFKNSDLQISDSSSSHRVNNISCKRSYNNIGTLWGEKLTFYTKRLQTIRLLNVLKQMAFLFERLSRKGALTERATGVWRPRGP